MNLTSGWESVPGGFWIATFSLVCLGGCAWLGLSIWLERGLTFQGRKHAAQLAALVCPRPSKRFPECSTGLVLSFNFLASSLQKRITSPQLQRDLEKIMADVDMKFPKKQLTRDGLKSRPIPMLPTPPFDSFLFDATCV